MLYQENLKLKCWNLWGIPIDPKYLSFKTRQIGQPVRFVELAQEINNSMPNYVISRISELMNKKEILLKNSKILLLGSI